MLDYTIKVLLFQTLFLAVYDLFLKKETFFQWNRVYIIATSVLAYIIPLIKINRVQEIIPQEYVVMLPEVVLNPTTTIERQFDWSIMFFLVLKVVFWFGVVIASLLFVYRLYKIIRLITTNEKEFTSNYCLVWLQHNKAFSFFKYIFLNKESKNKEDIIKHELVHVKQKHSLDLLFFELQKIVFWFNPYSYLYQNRIAELHEFIADSKTVKTENKSTYFNNLLAETFSTQHISFINPFFKQSLLKKRIVMLNKNKSKQLLKFKYALLIPVLLGMLVYTSCEKSEPVIEETPLEEIMIENPETKKFIDERLEKLLEELNSADIEDNGKKQMTKELLYLYLLQKREGKKLNSSTSDEVQTQLLSAIELSKGVPFAVIDKAPIFPYCENAEDPKKCLQENIQKYVVQKFNTGIVNTLGLESGKKKVYVQFKIDKHGNITEVRARGPHADIEREAMRVVNSLPKMIPGEHQGKKVAVKYTLPITLMVGEDNLGK